MLEEGHFVVITIAQTVPEIIQTIETDRNPKEADMALNI
jgi:hypothetical protein